MHPNHIKQWKDQLLDGVTDVSVDKPKVSKAPEIYVKSLHAKIGQLTLENDFLKGALDNNTAERAVKAMAIAFTLIETAKLNDVDPQGWLTQVLAQIADHKFTHLDAPEDGCPARSTPGRSYNII